MPAAILTLPKHLRPRREKVFGFARGFAHDRNARVRILTYIKAWNAKHKLQGHHQGPITAAHQRVLHALLWHFMSYKDGLCFPSYETIAGQACCCRATVYEAIKALEATGVFTWVNRIDRIAERTKDLFGKWMVSHRVVRRSNVYQFRDPLPCAKSPEKKPSASKSGNPSGHEIQEFNITKSEPKIRILQGESNLEAALFRLGRNIRAV